MMAHITEDDVREILLDHVANSCSCGICCDVFCCSRATCCWSKKPVAKMKFKKCLPSFAITCKLIDYSEQRHTEWRFKPYRGGSVDDRGNIPGDWDIDAGTDRRTPYTTGTEEIVMPGSEDVRECKRCDGYGDVRCWECNGKGQCRCEGCGGSGQCDMPDQNNNMVRQRCPTCNGRGEYRCRGCGGDGYRKCPRCDGEGELVWYLLLIVEWLMPEYHRAIQAIEESGEGHGVPEELLMEAHGHMLVDLKAPYLLPATDFSEHSIADSSIAVFDEADKALETHHRAHLGHIHRIEQIPMTEVTVLFDDKETMLFVYGNTGRLYFADASGYPTNCCFCCHRSSKGITDNIGLNNPIAPKEMTDERCDQLSDMNKKYKDGEVAPSAVGETLQV